MKLIPFDRENQEFYHLMDELKKVHDLHTIESMICVYKKKDGTVGFGTTYGNNAEMVGLVEMGKILLIEDSFNPDE